MSASAKVILLLLLFVVHISACNEAEVKETSLSGPVSLSFNLSADSVYRYAVKNNITISQEVDEESSITIEQNMTLVTGFDVISIKPENRTVAVTYERITMSSGNAAFSIDYDSESDNGTDIMYEDLRNLIDKTFRMTVVSDGTVVDSEPVIRGKNEGRGAYNVSDSSIRKILLHALELYPQGPVQKGDVWEHTYSTSVGFTNLRVRNRYRLMSVGPEIARVELQGRLSSVNTEQAQGSDMNIEGLQSGSFTIDVKSGLVINGKINQQLSGNMNITGKSTPVNIESDIYIMGSVKY